MMSEASTGPVPGSPVPASAIERLTLIANDVVEANGGVAPAWVSVVVTTQGEALTYTATQTNGQALPSWLISRSAICI